MVFICFSLRYSFNRKLELYERMKHSLIPWTMFSLIDKNLILTKNGTRRKAYLDNGILKYIKIQRMVLNNRIYFDLFPLTLIPNSLLKMEDSMIAFDDGRVIVNKRKKYTSFEKWLIQENLLDNLFSKVEIIGKTGNVFFFKSKEKHIPYQTLKGRKKPLEKRYFFLIFYS